MAVGRPRIGPKKQASVPPEVADWIEQERERRGERDESVITRELIILGHRVLTGVEA